MNESHTDLWYTIGGTIYPISKLYPEVAFPSTPLHVIDSYDGRELFCNPWGNGSDVALEKVLALVKSRANQQPRQQISLQQATDTIMKLQNYLEGEISAATESPLIRTFIELKGIPIAEVDENVSALGDLARDLRGRQTSLQAMLETDQPEQFMLKHNVIPRFGLVASGNLGLFESVVLIWNGILAQVARNGNQFSLTIKPSIYDFLFHYLIQRLPEHIRTAFSRVTWRSDAGILPDETLIGRLVNELDGLVYFGGRDTLINMRNQIRGDGGGHYFYYDHFPIMVILTGDDEEFIRKAAKVAVTLAYKQRGESCLSLQDVFVHSSVYRKFLRALMDEWNRLRKAKGDPKAPTTLVPSYSGEHLEEIVRLRARFNGSVIGKANPRQYHTDLLINYALRPEDWVLATENAAPLLCLAAFSDQDRLLQSLQLQLSRSASDKFIYALVLSPEGKHRFSTLAISLKPFSHRIEVVRTVSELQNFSPYSPGVPHCGGVSFLADMFGLPHNSACYVKGMTQS